MTSSYTRNRRPLKPHLTNAGGVAAEVKNLRADMEAELSGSLWTTQAAWAIDPINGRDSNIGTPALPLQTAEEFNNRFNNLFYRAGAGTLQLVGDVTDQPIWLSGTRFGTGTTLTISGTRTDTVSAIPITVVSSLGAGGTVFPWQLTTTGVDWTTINLATTQLRFSGGQVAGILQVVDANNVITGALIPTGTSTAQTTPTTAMTITLGTLSKALPMLFDCTGLATNSATPFIIAQNLNFDPANLHPWVIAAGSQVQMYGCLFNLTAAVNLASLGLFVIRGCRVNVNSTAWNWRTAGLPSGSQSCVYVGAGVSGSIVNHNTGVTVHSGLAFSGARLFATGAGMSLNGGVHIRNTQGPVVVQIGGVIDTFSIITGTNNTGFGIDVSGGTFGYFSTAKPTITGSSGDTRVGGLTKTYAEIPFINATLDAVPPTVATLVGNLAAIIVR